MGVKKGFTLVEVLIATAMLGLLTISLVPFIIQVNSSREQKIYVHNEVLREFSELNMVIGSKTYDDLISNSNTNTTISKVDGSKRLYKVESSSGIYCYIVLKE